MTKMKERFIKIKDTPNMVTRHAVLIGKGSVSCD